MDAGFHIVGVFYLYLQTDRIKFVFQVCTPHNTTFMYYMCIFYIANVNNMRSHTVALNMSCQCTEMSIWWWLLETCSSNFIEYIVVFWLNDILVSTATQRDGSYKKLLYVYHTAACFDKLVWPASGSFERGLVLSHTFLVSTTTQRDGSYKKLLYVYHAAACFDKLVWPASGSFERGLVLSHTSLVSTTTERDGSHKKWLYVYHAAACFDKLVWPASGSLERSLVLSHTFFCTDF